MYYKRFKWVVPGLKCHYTERRGMYEVSKIEIRSCNALITTKKGFKKWVHMNEIIKAGGRNN